MAKILIVDDDPDMVEASKNVLEMKGHDVATATSKDKGLEAIGSFSPELVILDVMMEEADDGISMAQKLRKTGFKSPILMVSGIGKITGLDYDKDDSMVPVDAFLEKPILPDTLISKVNELLK